MKALLLLALSMPAAAQSTATLRGIDVYRSATLSTEQAEQMFGPRLRLYMEMLENRKTKAQAERLRKEIIEAVRKPGSFAFADVYLGRYVTSVDHSAYITLDVVDAGDESARMPFRPAPAGRVTEADEIVKAWDDYLALGLEQRKAGRISYDRPSCPAYYCLYGSQTPELAAYEQKFVEFSRSKRDILVKAARGETDPRKRAAATYLLSYAPEGKTTVDSLFFALQDPDQGVRSAGLEVLADISTHHKDVPIEVLKLLPALDYPTTVDRSKALAVLVGLVENPDYSVLIVAGAGQRIVELLKQQQPAIHDLAYTVLSLLSKESYARRDYVKWYQWLDKQSKKK